MRGEPFDAAPALSHLAPFQRRTVDYVFERFYGADPVRHFLVADEVGLGKTMVARGVIARAVEALWSKAKRIDILYICSNQAIAAQNLNRLNVLGRQGTALPTRITLIPLQLRGENRLSAGSVNFISLTPATTFNLRSTTGVAQERALLLRLLEPLAPFAPLKNALQHSVGDESWDRHVEAMTLDDVDPTIVRRFQAAVRRDAARMDEIGAACHAFSRRRSSYAWEHQAARNALIGSLRATLSHACVRALKPDLIILDEFQRFRTLLRGNDEAAELARALFDYGQGTVGARTLLLSATPYKMLTLPDDAPDDGDHHQDFLETVAFLYGRERGEQAASALDAEMRRFRGFLQQLPAAEGQAVLARAGIEQHLRQVIARTERVDSTAGRDSMLVEPPMPVALSPLDLQQAATVARVARAVDAPETIEYWKSAPYLLNFMRDYSLKRRLREAQPTPGLLAALSHAQAHALNRNAIERYDPIEPGNGRMRGLMADLFGARLDQHLWIPPALPYYGEEPVDPPLTKALVFSAWQMVPDALAALLSYEAERRMGTVKIAPSYFEASRRRPLQFKVESGRPAAMRALNLLYPSPTLARLGDPLAIFSMATRRPHYAEMRDAVRELLRTALARASDIAAIEPANTAISRSAEWSTAPTIDALLGTKATAWLRSREAFGWSKGEDGLREHIAELSNALDEPGIGPADGVSLDLLVDIALGSPAVCALRALHRIAPDLEWDDPGLLEGAAVAAWGFRTLFNQHEAIALLRQESDEHYWRSVLSHCAINNLQAVLDEYAHYLVDSEGVAAAAALQRVNVVARAIRDAISVRPSQIDVDDVAVENDNIVFKPPIKMRGRFAMRLAEQRDEEGGAVRIGSVREAFNSPFRPFVLATTSIGQEGLDFHPYCYKVYHWNLPSNPVDLEQREGRVHRFKGHAVRLNIARAHADAVRHAPAPPPDPWTAMFEAARAASSSTDGLIPFWIYEGPVKVERRVPMLPFSREVKQLERLKRSLTLYRLAFGQPRQDDLIAYFARLIGEGFDAASLLPFQIRLQP